MGKKVKKAPGVGVDFKRVKHKVGKKLRKPQNETQLDFKSRSIALPSQNIGQDAERGVVSERKLTLKDLLGQVGHYSEKTRKDALQQLQQLLGDHPQELRRNAGAVLAALAPRCSDGDKAVRGALQSLLRAAVLPGLGAGQVAPFMPLLMAHVGSALTHLEPAVRTDALALLDALMDTVPALLVGGAAPASDAAVGGAAAAAAAAAGSGSSYLGVCLTHFRDHLSRGVRGRSIKAQAIGPLAVTLGQLQRFLARAFPAAAAGGAPGGGEGPAAAVAGTAPDAGPAGGAAGDAGVRPLQACRAQAGRPADGLAHPQALLRLYCSPAEAAAWQLQQRHDRLASHAAASSSGGGRGPGSQPPKGRKAGAKAAASAPAPVAAAAAGGEGGPAAVSQGQAAALQLLDALWDCWAECAPATLSISPEEDSTQALVHILSCSHLLLTGMGLLPAPAAAAAAATGSALPAAWQVARPLQQNSAHVQAAARLVLPRLAPAFPAGCPAVGPPPAVQALLQRFNLLGAQLLAALLAAGAVWPPPQAAAAVAASEAAWASRLVGYVCLLLVHGDVVPSADALAPLTMAAGADLPAAGPSSRAAAGKPGAVTNATYLAALAAAQQVLPCLPHAERRRLLAAVKQLAAGVQPRSPVQTGCAALQRQVLVAHVRGGVADAELERDLADWLAAAPKLLWELGGKAPATSRVLLLTLHDAARFSTPGSLLQAAVEQLAPQLAPLLLTPLPGDPGGASTPVVLGPLGRLPGPQQQLGMDLLASLPCYGPSLLKAIVIAAQTGAYPQPAVSRLLDGLLHRAPSVLPPDVYLSLIASLLTPPAVAYVWRGGGGGGGGGGDGPAGGFERHLAVVRCVCRWLPAYGQPSQLLQLLEPCLMHQWQQLAPAAEPTAAAGGGGGGDGASSEAARVCMMAASLACIASSAAAACATGGDASTLPQQLLDSLPAIIAALMWHWAAAGASSGETAAAQGGAGAAAAPGTAASMQLAWPLLEAAPALVMPFVQRLLAAVRIGGQQQQQQARLAALFEVLQLLLASKALQPTLQQAEQELWSLLEQLQEVVGQLQAAGTDGAEQQAQACQRLRAALQNKFARA